MRLGAVRACNSTDLIASGPVKLSDFVFLRRDGGHSQVMESRTGEPDVTQSLNDLICRAFAQPRHPGSRCMLPAMVDVRTSPAN
jgi:hypothetical protein